jgi:hypothetical protein
VAEVYREVRIPDLMNTSVKAVLDVDWSDADQKASALEKLLGYVERLGRWLERQDLLEAKPLMPYIEALTRVQEQNIEVDEKGRRRMRQGVAEDRQTSIEDPEMRHGRKSASKRFNGFKEHIAADLDTNLILACAVTPANRPEEEATPALAADLGHLGVVIGELSIDRAYVNSEIAREVHEQGGEVLAKPWRAANSNRNLFTKTDFKIDLKRGAITCPAGQVEPFEPGDVVEFDPEVCGACPLRSGCTLSASGRGRTVRIGEDEAAQQRYRKLQRTRPGRARLRHRVGIEHRLARVARTQGPRARYTGVRKNLFDLRRTAAVNNLEAVQARIAA